MRREGYVAINFALDEIFLVMEVSNHYDIIMEKKWGSFYSFARHRQYLPRNKERR
jgi:hypothetical protein